MEKLFLVVHTHWDREWYQPFQQMRARLVAMTDKMLPMVESGALPHFHFDGQTIVLDDYLEVRPANHRRLAALIKAGKIAIGPWYVLADSFLVSGESIIRNLEIGMASARRFGNPLDVGYLPDQFGHIAQMPQILTGFGFKTAMLWRGVPHQVNRSRFIWEAPDGSRVFTVYLPFGYSNGANLPLDSTDALFSRGREIAAREQEFAGGAPILVMNGTDHAHPDPRLMQRVADANAKGGISFEVGRLEDYIKRLAEIPLAELPVHRGELRSPSRAHLLPSVTSARTWIKQRDFENCATLERFADPLAALAHLHGGGKGLNDFLELAWRTEIQNHPHDSICGCSVDQVHEDMRYRFDQASMVANSVIRDASKVLLQDQAGGTPMLAVFNPTFAREAVVSGEMELERGAYSAADRNGLQTPLTIDFAQPERMFDVQFPATEFKRIVAGLSAPEVLGRTVNRYEIRKSDGGRVELDLSLGRGATTDVDLDRFRDDIRNTLPDGGAVRIRAATLGRSRVSFVAQDLEQAGFSFYRLVKDDSRGASQDRPGTQAIGNEFYRIEPSARGFAIRDLTTGSDMELYFEDDGDRGDEYNFDPVPGSSAISEPKSLTVHGLEDTPTRKRLQLLLGLEVPEAISEDRKSRCAKQSKIDVLITATAYSGLNLIEFNAEFENRARDHRLRAALRTPVSTIEAVSDSSFGVVRRRLQPTEPRGTEDIYPTVPHRSVTAVESDAVSVALMSRGLYEIEARRDPQGTTLLLTLLRCVGWLSRSDLAMRDGGAGPEFETPGAQELGRHQVEFAMTAYQGGYLEADLMNRAAAYAFQPRIFSASEAASRRAPMQLLRCNNSRVLFSTARPATRENSYVARAYSVSPNVELALFAAGEGVALRLIDLAGRPVRRDGVRRRRGGALEVKLRPFEIVTLRVDGAKKIPQLGQKD